MVFLLLPRAPSLVINPPSGDSASTSTFLTSLGQFSQDYKRSQNIFCHDLALRLRGLLDYRDFDGTAVSKYQKDEERVWRQADTNQIPVLPHSSCVSLGKRLNLSVP